MSLLTVVFSFSFNIVVFVFDFFFCYLVAFAITPHSPCALLFLKFRLVFLVSHLVTLMPCTLMFSRLAPCYFRVLHLVAFCCHALFLSHHALLFSCLATPLSHALLFMRCALLFLFSHLAIFILTPCYSHQFVVRTLLFSHCTLLFYLSS